MNRVQWLTFPQLFIFISFYYFFAGIQWVTYCLFLLGNRISSLPIHEREAHRVNIKESYLPRLLNSIYSPLAFIPLC